MKGTHANTKTHALAHKQHPEIKSTSLQHVSIYKASSDCTESPARRAGRGSNSSTGSDDTHTPTICVCANVYACVQVCKSVCVCVCVCVCVYLTVNRDGLWPRLDVWERGEGGSWVDCFLFLFSQINITNGKLNLPIYKVTLKMDKMWSKCLKAHLL